MLRDGGTALAVEVGHGCSDRAQFLFDGDPLVTQCAFSPLEGVEEIDLRALKGAAAAKAVEVAEQRRPEVLHRALAAREPSCALAQRSLELPDRRHVPSLTGSSPERRSSSRRPGTRSLVRPEPAFWDTVADPWIGDGVGTKPESKEEAVLLDLCVRFGYCLPISTQVELLSRPTWTPGELVDAVIEAEGLEPTSDPNRPGLVEHAERIFRSPAWSSEP